MKFRMLFSVVLVGTLVACQSSQQRLYLFNWSYYIPDEVLADFRRETGIRVILDTYDSNESMYAKLKSGNAHYDLVVPSSDYVEIMREQGMLVAIDQDLLPNLAYIDANIQPLLAFDPYHEVSVPYFVGAAGINVNVGKVGVLEPSWSIFGMQEFKGRMSMMNDMRETLGAALAYNGFSINSINEQEIDQAKQTILSWKPNLLKFDAEMFGKDFASGAVSIAHGYAEVVLTELEDADGVQYMYLLPREGGVIYVDNLVILASSKNQELAHQFINYLLRPEVHAKIADTFYYPTIMQAAHELREREAAYEVGELVELGYEVKRNLADALELYSRAWSEILRG